MLKRLVISAIIAFAGLSLFAVSGVNAQERQYKQFIKGTDYVTVEFYPSIGVGVLPAVTDSFTRAGYIVRDETKPLPTHGTSCEVYIMNPKDRILCRCMSRPGGPQIFIQENIGTTGDDFGNIISTLAKLHDMYRRASAAIGIK